MTKIVCLIISILIVTPLVSYLADLIERKKEISELEAVITLRGHALLIAIDTGLVKENESGNYEIGAFLEFYDRFLQLVDEDCLKERK